MEERNAMHRDQLLTAGDLDKFKTELLAELRTLVKELKGQPAKEWLRSSEVRKMLGVSAGTLQNLRVNGTLPYSKLGSIVFYKRDEILKLLEKNTTPR
jgi:hypothetical protein